VARKAREKGLTSKPWVKTSLAPGLQVVTDYLEKALACRKIWMPSASTLSAMAAPPASATPARWIRADFEAINEGDLVACSVLSGNRNFEGRVNPHVQANYLASPPLVVAYAIAGTMLKDVTRDPLGQDKTAMMST
jgi:aconitate hydratase